MKITSHSFDNSVFNSLLGKLEDQIVLKTNPKAEQTKVANTMFTSKDGQQMDQVQIDQLEKIAQELTFAAEKTKIELTEDDITRFANEVLSTKIKGKNLEKAARKFCSNLHRSVAAPEGCKKVADVMTSLSNSHVVVPGNYASDSINNSKAGKYLGSSKNPNSIWDTEALQRQATVPLGDEQIHASVKAKVQHAQSLKEASKKELENIANDPNNIVSKIQKSASAEDTTAKFNPKAPINSMSIFSQDRDFENIPMESLGEKVIKEATARAKKRQQEKISERDIQGAKKLNSGIDNLFETK